MLRVRRGRYCIADCATLGVLFVPDALLELLVRHVAEHRRDDCDETRWLFEATPGQPHRTKHSRARLAKGKQKGGRAGLELHDLRRYYASALIAAGCDVVTVQRALGHAKATTTLNAYAHLWQTAEERTRAAADDLMASVVGPADSLRTDVHE